MRHRAQETISIGWQINSCKLRFQGQYCANETWILVGEPVMFLTSPSRRLDVVQRTTWEVLTPWIACDFDELGVLHHHRVDNSKEGLIRRENTSSASKCVSLEHPLTNVFRKDLYYPAIITAWGNIPLEITRGDIENGVQLVGDEFIRRENAECFWIPRKGSIDGWVIYVNHKLHFLITSLRNSPTAFMQLSCDPFCTQSDSHSGVDNGV